MKIDPPKRRSFHEPGHAHELTFCCYHKYPFLQADRARVWLAEPIVQSRSKLGFCLWAYVFMPDHVHLILQWSNPNLRVSTVLRTIKEPVGRKAAQFLVKHAPEWLPKVTQTRGGRTERHFWQPGGGYDRNIIEPTTLMAMIDYIHLNPVRKGLSDRPSEWHWSSAGWYEEGRTEPMVIDPIPPEWTEG